MHEAMNINPQLMGHVKESIKAPNTLYEYLVAIATFELLYVSKITQWKQLIKMKILTK